MPSITVSWNEAPDNDNVQFVDIHGANGTSVAFGSCPLLTSVSGRDTSWSDPAVAAGQARTYYLVFRNVVGSSSPEGPINITAGSLSSSYVQNHGGAPSVQEGTHAGRPAAGNAGAIYIETDTQTLWRDNGATWDEIGSSGGTPGGSSGQIQYNNAGAFGGFTMSGDVTTNTATGVATIKSSVALAGSPTTTTQAAGDNSTKIATDAFVTTAIANAIAGVNPAVAVQAATTAAANTSAYTYNNGASGIGATLTGVANTALTVDGYTFTALGQRLLVKNDTQSPSGAFNGVYYVTQVQTALLPVILTRALDYDMPSDINNTGAIPVVNGTVNALTSWLLTSTVATVGTDPLTYSQFSFNTSGTVTHTGGGLTSGQLIVGNGSADIKVGDLSGDVSTSGSGVTTIGALKVATGMIQAAAVTYAKIQNVSANSVLLGAGASGSGGAPVEITLGSGLAMAGNVLSASGVAGTSGLTLIGKVVTAASQTSITFSSIPATYSHLRLIVWGRSPTGATADDIVLVFNSDTAAHYNREYMIVAGGSVSAGQELAATNTSPFSAPGALATANYASGGEVIIFGYASTTFNKSFASTGGINVSSGASGAQILCVSGTWINTAALNTILITLRSGSGFVNGSIACLYGMA